MGAVSAMGKPGPDIFAMGSRLTLTGPAGVSVSQCESHNSFMVQQGRSLFRTI